MKEENTEARSCTCCCSSKEKSIEKDYELHWNKAFDRTDVNNLGWYEENPKPSLDLIKKCNLTINSSILNVGAGATTLVDELINLGYENIIANDLSSSALNKLKERLGKDSNKVKWIEDNLTKPEELNSLKDIDLWHDRAVLHFFNDKKDQDTYFDLLRKVIKKTGYVIIAAFHLNGASKCCGLPVHRYDENMLKEKIGTDFELLESFQYTYLNPSGDPREYIYTLFKRIN